MEVCRAWKKQTGTTNNGSPIYLILGFLERRETSQISNLHSRLAKQILILQLVKLFNSLCCGGDRWPVGFPFYSRSEKFPLETGLNVIYLCCNHWTKSLRPSSSTALLLGGRMEQTDLFFPFWHWSQSPPPTSCRISATAHTDGHFGGQKHCVCLHGVFPNCCVFNLMLRVTN